MCAFSPGSSFLIHRVKLSFLIASLRRMSSLVVTRAALCPSFSSPNAGRSGMWVLKCHRSLQNADSRMPGITGVGSERGDRATSSFAKNSLFCNFPGTQWQDWGRRARRGAGWGQATWVCLCKQPSWGWGEKQCGVSQWAHRVGPTEKQGHKNPKTVQSTTKHIPKQRKAGEPWFGEILIYTAFKKALK